MAYTDLISDTEIKDISYLTKKKPEIVHPRITYRGGQPYVYCNKQSIPFESFLRRFADGEKGLRLAGYRKSNGRQTSIAFESKDQITLSSRFIATIETIRHSSAAPPKVTPTISSSQKIESSMASQKQYNAAEIRTYQGDPAKRKLVEVHAVELAIAHYKRLGFVINEKGKPYDLDCSKGTLKVHVEVKGTTGLGEKVILTRNEINDARNLEWRSDLFIVRNIKIDGDGESMQATGGDERCLVNWHPADKDLEAMQYDYRVPQEP